MTRRQAEDQGLIFTGRYTSRPWEREEYCVKFAAEIRKKYKCRAVVVPEENGWSVYADEKYEYLKRLEECEVALRNIPIELDRLHNKYEQDVAGVQAKEIALAAEAEAIRTKYGIKKEDNN